MGQSQRGRRDSGESLNDFRPVLSPLRRMETPSSLFLGLCLTSLFALVVLGALTRSSWLGALAMALCFGVAIAGSASHVMRCLRCGRVLSLPLCNSTHLDLIPDPRLCERCQDRPPPDAC